MLWLALPIALPFLAALVLLHRRRRNARTARARDELAMRRAAKAAEYAARLPEPDGLDDTLEIDVSDEPPRGDA